MIWYRQRCQKIFSKEILNEVPMEKDRKLLKSWREDTNIENYKYLRKEMEYFNL